MDLKDWAVVTNEFESHRLSINSVVFTMYRSCINYISKVKNALNLDKYLSPGGKKSLRVLEVTQNLKESRWRSLEGRCTQTFIRWKISLVVWSLNFSTEIHNWASFYQVTELARADNSCKLEISDIFRNPHGLATVLIYFVGQMSGRCREGKWNEALRLNPRFWRCQRCPQHLDDGRKTRLY